MNTFFSILFFVVTNFAYAACEDTSPKDTNKFGFKFVWDCTCEGNWQKIYADESIKKKLTIVSRTVKQTLPVYSCFRSQESQDEILKKNKCAPKYGDVPCAGRIAAAVSEHTVGIAADFFISDFQGEVADLCRILDQTRAKAGGRGGITVYGIENGRAALHMDSKSDWCNWGMCEKVLGEGHCLRTKWRSKVAQVEKNLAEAKLAKSQSSIKKLEKLLKSLKSDCPPNDEDCRFKG
jgi:hypothetical protein